MKPEGVSMREIPVRETSNLRSVANLWRGLQSPGNSVKSLQNTCKYTLYDSKRQREKSISSFQNFWFWINIKILNQMLKFLKLGTETNNRQNKNVYICSYPKWENLQGEPRDWGSPEWPYRYWNAKTSAGYRLPIATKILPVSITTEEATCGGFLSMWFHSSIYQNSFTVTSCTCIFFCTLPYFNLTVAIHMTTTESWDREVILFLCHSALFMYKFK